MFNLFKKENTDNLAEENHDKYSYDDEIRITSEFLDKIDILQYTKKHMKLYELMDIIEDNNPAPEDDFFEGCLFNRMNVYEFEDYLMERYEGKLHTYDVSTTYVDLND